MSIISFSNINRKCTLLSDVYIFMANLSWLLNFYYKQQSFSTWTLLLFVILIVLTVMWPSFSLLTVGYLFIHSFIQFLIYLSIQLIHSFLNIWYSFIGLYLFINKQYITSYSNFCFYVLIIYTYEGWVVEQYNEISRKNGAQCMNIFSI